MSWGDIGDTVKNLFSGATYGSWTDAYEATQSQASLLTPEQQTALADILPYLYGQATTSPQLGGTNEYLEDYFSSNVEQPLTQQYQNEVIPGIRESAGTLHSSTTGNQIQKANTDLANQLSSQKSNLYWQNYQSQLAQQQGSLASLLAALGVTGVENIVNQPSAIQGFLKSAFK